MSASKISEQETRYSLIDRMLKTFCLCVVSLVDFLKPVLHLETLPTYETFTLKAFDAFILEYNYNADQSRFLSVVQSVFLQRKKLELAYESEIEELTKGLEE
ncbi:MAG: hypothetical protein HY960_00595 [Ignavibacteriae bacterium]|nr:hypothetical protein [Ignavibacteriota bacterium]